MDWEDCVVDVHSVKLSKSVLETMFKECGTVRSITHWKGQGVPVKPHVFFEYKSPAAADSARAIGLDRSDVQVIKISNNEMLKRKFKELAHGPLRERDQRCRPTDSSPRSTYAHFSRDSSINSVSGGEYRFPAKSTELSAHPRDRDAWAKCEAPHRYRGEGRDAYRRPSASASVGSSSSKSQEHHSRRDRSLNKEYNVTQPLTASQSLPLTPPIEVASAGDKTRHLNYEKSLSILQIPHAGEIIKFDLDTQLEENPTGIIRILSAVKAHQKLWMITAAYYKGKHNLDSAKTVLEAGIDMAVQVGEEADTKPFWHLLGQINSIIQERLAPPIASSAIPTLMTPSVPFTANSTSPGATKGAYIQPDIHELGKPSSPTREIPPLRTTSYQPTHASSVNSSQLHNAHNSAAAEPRERHLIPCFTGHSVSSQPWPTGPRKRDVYSIAPPPSSPTPPSGPMPPPARMCNLQNEVGVLREKQAAVLEDLSFARAAKRRAEDEVKEERSIRRKLEKHLRAAEDALARSKRMEDAALDQVKREVEARRRAEGLLADFKARKEQAERPVGGTGQSLFTSNTNDAAVLFHLASMIRGVPSNERAIALPFANGGSIASPARINGDLAMTEKSET